MTTEELLLDARIFFLCDYRFKLIDEMRLGLSGDDVNIGFRKSIQYIEDEIENTQLKLTILKINQYDNKVDHN